MKSLEKLCKFFCMTTAAIALSSHITFAMEDDEDKRPLDQISDFYQSSSRIKQLSLHDDLYQTGMPEIGYRFIQYLNKFPKISDINSSDIRGSMSRFIASQRSTLVSLVGSEREPVIALYLFNDWLKLYKNTRQDQLLIAQCIVQIANGNWYGLSSEGATDEERSVILIAGAGAGQCYRQGIPEQDAIDRIANDCLLTSAKPSNAQEYHRALFATAMLYPLFAGNSESVKKILAPTTAQQLLPFVDSVFKELREKDHSVVQQKLDGRLSPIPERSTEDLAGAQKVDEKPVEIVPSKELKETPPLEPVIGETVPQPLIKALSVDSSSELREQPGDSSESESSETELPSQEQQVVIVDGDSSSEGKDTMAAEALPEPSFEEKLDAIMEKYTIRQIQEMFGFTKTKTKPKKLPLKNRIIKEYEENRVEFDDVVSKH